MNSFSISQLEEFSGIKAHTIRIWEQRYNALQPSRSEGNTRYYDGSQLRRLLNIVSLMDSKYKVSELCSMTDEQLAQILNEQLKKVSTAEDATEYFVLQLIAAGISYDEIYFEKIFSNCLLRLGMRNAYVQVIYPMFVRLGQMWAADSISTAQEHFITNIVRQKLFSVIDSLPPAKSSKNSWLLFLPENEFHEMGLLLSHYLIRQAGKKVIYLGSNVPLDTLKNVVTELSPSHLLFFLVHYDKSAGSQKYLNTLSKNFSKTKIHVSGSEKLIGLLKTGKEINWVRSVEELEKQLL